MLLLKVQSLVEEITLQIQQEITKQQIYLYFSFCKRIRNFFIENLDWIDFLLNFALNLSI